MKNFVKEISEKAAVEAFTFFAHYQPKMPASLMEKIEDKNKKED